MVSKNLLEEMLKRNLKGELGGSMDSVLMENILIYAIEKVEEAEAQQREIEQLKTTIDSKNLANENLYKFNKQLIQENELLQARVARAREALIIAGNITDIGQFCACGKCNACGVDINYAMREYCTDCARTIIDAAIAEIDKVLGG